MALNPTDPKLPHLNPRHYAAVWFWLGVTPGALSGVTAPSKDQWRQAYDRWKWCFMNADEIFERKEIACILIRQAAERGDLVFHARNEATGHMVPVPRELWNCDTDMALARMASGRINLLDPMRPVPVHYKERAPYFARMTSWLFVAEDKLAAFLASLKQPRALEAVKRTNRAQGLALSWLLEQFKDQGTKSIAKPTFRQQAKERYPGLSSRAFDRAWASALADYPERGSAGSKGNRRA